VQAYLRFCGLLAGRDYVLEDCGPASIARKGGCRFCGCVCVGPLSVGPLP
jgi:hypothetical protein